jgi:hypothetical protein
MVTTVLVLMVVVPALGAAAAAVVRGRIVRWLAVLSAAVVAALAV